MAQPHYDENTALLVVDVQNDFAHPEGSLYVDGGEDVVDVANREVRRARDAGTHVAYSRDWHPPDTPHFEKHGGEWPVHCVRDTWGAEFHSELEVDGEVIHKATGPEDGYSAFSVRHLPSGEDRGTGLEELLRERDVERLVVLGIATDVCVKETVLDALRLGFQTEVLVEGVRAVDREAGDGERALEELQAAGAKLL